MGGARTAAVSAVGGSWPAPISVRVVERGRPAMDDEDVVPGVDRDPDRRCRGANGSAAASARTDPPRTSAPARRLRPARPLVSSADLRRGRARPSSDDEARTDDDVARLASSGPFVDLLSEFGEVYAESSGPRVTSCRYAHRSVPAITMLLAAASLPCCRWWSLRLRGAAAHDVPDRRDRAGLPQAGGPAAAPAGARAARGHARHGLSHARAQATSNLARVDPRCARRRKLWIADRCELYEDDARLRRPASSRARVSLPSDRASPPTRRRSPTSRPRRCRTRRSSTGARACSTCCSSTRSGRSSRGSRSIPASPGSGCASVTVLRFLPPGGAVRAFELPAIRAWSGSTRGGIRPPFASCGWASSTSSTAPTTCSSCCAW